MKYEQSKSERTQSFWNALDQVARERKYLLFLEGPEISRTEKFLKEIEAKNWTQIFAIEDDEVIGWCDIIPYERDGIRHVGQLGMGVIKNNRGKGIGTELIDRAIKDAFSKGIERIELEVFASNSTAIKLYEKFCFHHEGIKRKAILIDSVYDDIVVMSLLKEEAQQVAGGDRPR